MVVAWIAEPLVEHTLNLLPWASGDMASTIVSVSFLSTLGSPTVEQSES